VSLFCRNYRRCSCSRSQHPGVSLTYGDAFQQCSQQPVTFSKSYGECLDQFLTSSELIECGSRTHDLCPSPRSGRGLMRSASGIFACCGPFGTRKAINRPLQQSISGFLAINHGKPKTRSYTFIGTTKTSDLSTSLRCSITEPRDWPFTSLYTSSPGQGESQCWFVWQLEFPKKARRYKDAHCTTVDLGFDSLHVAMYIWYKVGFIVSAAAASALAVCLLPFVDFL
jgi:hypothetical protein